MAAVALSMCTVKLSSWTGYASAGATWHLTAGRGNALQAADSAGGQAGCIMMEPLWQCRQVLVSTRLEDAKLKVAVGSGCV